MGDSPQRRRERGVQREMENKFNGRGVMSAEGEGKRTKARDSAT
jgi:hypothetical protein